MRRWLPSLVLTVAALIPTNGNAQVFQFKTPSPEVTAANSTWQVSSEPIIFQGLIYYPTRDYRIFDGQVMAQIGVFQGVPIYADTTREPFHLIYVPVERSRMRAWEWVRDRELPGPAGSRALWFPGRAAIATTPVTTSGAPFVAQSVVEGRPVGTAGTVEERPVGTAGTIVPSAVGAMAAPRVPDRVRPSRITLESIPMPPPGRGNNGIWLEFNGSRWYSAGGAVPFRPERFTPIGGYRGFPVYRANTGDQDLIWVSVVPDGPLAPYEKR
jgi:hypothetical protein